MIASCFLQETLSRAPKRGGVCVLALCVLWLSGATLCSPATAASNDSSTVLSAAAKGLRTDYRQQHWQRLAARTDRDSLVAAVLIGIPTESQAQTMTGQSELEQRLADISAQDPLALFVLALSCQHQSPPCPGSSYYDALVRLAPDNAVHWTLLPNGAAPSPAQLHQAGLASVADSHTRELARIVRTALGEQPIVAASAGIDRNELALLLRRNLVDQMAYPNLAPMMAACRNPDQPNSSDCVAVGRKLMADRSGCILPAMVGSAVIRRQLKGSADAAAALELRRDYVWLSIKGPLETADAASAEAFRAEIVEFGEWEAWHRRLDQLGVPRKPPLGWIPPDPQVLLLAEDRARANPSK